MAEGKASNLTIRIATAIVGVPAILALIFVAPPWGFYRLVLAAVVVGSSELFAMTHPGDRASIALGVLVSAATSLAFFFGHADPRALVTLLVAVPLLGPLLTLARLGDMKTAALRATAMGMGPLFVAVPLTMLALLRVDHPKDGTGFVVLAMGCAWISDTGGYFAGRFLGKHKLYEAVSPKKTVEGAIGGLLAGLAGAIFIRFVLLPMVPLSHMVALAIVAGAFGQAGDLGESLLKRSFGVKDSGGIVPGHGGILDRVDAMLVTATLTYLYVLWTR